MHYYIDNTNCPHIKHEGKQVACIYRIMPDGTKKLYWGAENPPVLVDNLWDMEWDLLDGYDSYPQTGTTEGPDLWLFIYSVHFSNQYTGAGKTYVHGVEESYTKNVNDFIIDGTCVVRLANNFDGYEPNEPPYGINVCVDKDWMVNHGYDTIKLDTGTIGIKGHIRGTSSSLPYAMTYCSNAKPWTYYL